MRFTDKVNAADLEMRRGLSQVCVTRVDMAGGVLPLILL